jgi:hypothetical protein
MAHVLQDQYGFHGAVVVLRLLSSDKMQTPGLAVPAAPPRQTDLTKET